MGTGHCVTSFACGTICINVTKQFGICTCVLSCLGTSKCVVNQVTVSAGTHSIFCITKCISMVDGRLIEPLFVTLCTVSDDDKFDNATVILFRVTTQTRIESICYTVTVCIRVIYCRFTVTNRVATELAGPGLSTWGGITYFAYSAVSVYLT